MSVTVSHGHRHWHSTAARLSVGAPPGVTVIPNAAAAQARPQRPAATIAAAAATAGHGHSDCRDGWWRVLGRRIPSRAGITRRGGAGASWQGGLAACTAHAMPAVSPPARHDTDPWPSARPGNRSVTSQRRRPGLRRPDTLVTCGHGGGGAPGCPIAVRVRAASAGCTAPSAAHRGWLIFDRTMPVTE